MSTTAFKPGDLVRIKSNIFNGEGLVKGDIVEVAEVAENTSDRPQGFTSIIMPSGKVLSWFNDRFKKIDSWTNATPGLKGCKYYIKGHSVWSMRHGDTWKTGFIVPELAELEGFVKNPAVEVSEHGFTVGQRLYTTNSQWPEIDFVGESTFNDKPYVKGIHSVWGVAGHFHLSEVSATAPLADWEKELLEDLKEDLESEPPFAREGVIYRRLGKVLDGFEFRIKDGVLEQSYPGSYWKPSGWKVSNPRFNAEYFEVISVGEDSGHGEEVEAGAKEEYLPPVSRKHFDESKAAGERRRQKLIKHVETLQARLGEKNKVIAQQEGTLRSIRNLVM